MQRPSVHRRAASRSVERRDMDDVSESSLSLSHRSGLSLRSDKEHAHSPSGIEIKQHHQPFGINSADMDLVKSNRHRGQPRWKGSSTHSAGTMGSTGSGKLRVTRRMTNLVWCLLGMVPSMLLYFGHVVHYIPSGGEELAPHHVMSGDTLKKQFMEKDTIPKPKQLRVVDPYSPSLILPQEIKPTYNRTVLHFVKTRFMQYQPNLTALGGARLELFEDFCMPSVVHQTTQNFVWLVYTDPDLHDDLLRAMVDLLAPYPNYYLIKTLSNSMWKGGQAQNMTQATVYTGDRDQLEAFMALRNQLPVLETRLDADDALHIGYLEEIQSQAIPFFTKEGVDWMYWCVNQELEWNWIGPEGYNNDQKQYGVMESKPYEDFCPTPGLTLGYAATTPVESIYSRRHSVLVERLHTKTDYNFCGRARTGKDCYQIISKFEYPAMRCRTPTSASMVMTNFTKGYKLKQIAKQGLDPRWKALHESFAVPRNNVQKANAYMTNNILAIARDALMGQCTKGHSCSVSDDVAGRSVDGRINCCTWFAKPSQISSLLPLPLFMLQQNARTKLVSVMQRYAAILGKHDDADDLV